MNTITIWQKKYKVYYKLISYLLPPLKEKYLLSKRKKVYKRVCSFIEQKNQYLTDTGGSFFISIWASSDLSSCHLLIENRVLSPRLDPKPFRISLTGRCTIDQPLKIKFDLEIVKLYLLQAGINSTDTIFKLYSALQKINSKLFKLNCDENSHFFIFAFWELLNEIDNFNKTFFEEIGYTCHFMILEYLRLKWQRKKYRYNKIYHFQSKSFENVLKIQKLFCFFRKETRLSIQCNLLFAPIVYKGLRMEEFDEDFENSKKGRPEVSFNQRTFLKDLSRDKELLTKFLGKSLIYRSFRKVI